MENTFTIKTLNKIITLEVSKWEDITIQHKGEENNLCGTKQEQRYYVYGMVKVLIMCGEIKKEDAEILLDKFITWYGEDAKK